MRLKQPTWPRALPSGLIVAIATLGPLGMRLPAPGTWGSLAGLVYFSACFTHLGPLSYLLLCALGLYLAVAFCGEAESRMRRRDPGEVILDEVVAMPLCFLDWHALTPVMQPWVALLTGFALFRFFDILKPLGIKRLQSLPDGWGVVVDDVAAALAACGCLHLIAWYLRSRY